jgi:two-component system, response regulator / RNA-binding antiterminator
MARGLLRNGILTRTPDRMLRVMLVADDSQKDVSLLNEALKQAGYDVVEVSTSASALLDRVAALQPDVIIIDSDSPTRDTLEQLSFVNERQPRPIVLFTEDRDSATIQAALQAGVSAYIVAGMQPDRLQPILDVAVARFEQERALRDELRDTQQKLAERKLIERAKGIVMKQKNVDEDEAYRVMRKLAMDRNRKLMEIAQQIIDVSELMS